MPLHHARIENVDPRGAMIPHLYPDFDPSFADLRKAMPAIAFFGGFLWAALTLARSVSALDLWLLTRSKACP